MKDIVKNKLQFFEIYNYKIFIIADMIIPPKIQQIKDNQNNLSGLFIPNLSIKIDRTFPWL